MPGPRPKFVELSAAERRGLETLSSAHTTGQQLALRSRIILAADAGQNNTEIARTLQISVETARGWRQRWLDLAPIPLAEMSVAERLEDLPRPGAPARITADQLCQLTALACEAPEQAGRPISQWTGRELADELMNRGIVDRISPRHAQRLFKRSRPQAPSDSLLADARL